MTAVGLDVLEIARFRRALERQPRLAARLFTAGELGDLAGRSDPVPGLAARFAAKEATMKALGVGLGAVDFAEIEVLRSPSGAPQLRTHGRAAALAAERGVQEFTLSLTHSKGVAAAVVLVL
ncbi:MAG TPA: holo-ACP synthase [Acidimicrobiales bacterium]|nr:holo-ACP synthase [Acidimicrobiales bacterium]